MENILLKLNGFLVADQLDIKQFERILMRLKKRLNPQIGVIDFKYFDERRLRKARREKLKGEQIHNLQYARNLQYLERVCQQYMVLKSMFDLKGSTFLFEDEKNILLYCHFGSSKNDPQIMLCIIEDEKYIKLNIKI